MLAVMYQLHFLRPYWFILFAPILYLLMRLYQQQGSTMSWYSICDAHLLKHLLVDSKAKQRVNISFTVVACCWTLAIIALAGPTWQKIELPIYRQLVARVLVIDLSATMTTEDVKPSRISRAKYKLFDLLRHSEEAQVGLLAVGAEPFLVSPLTQDAKTIAALVPELSVDIMPVQQRQANLAAAIDMAANMLRQAGAAKGDIILLTDSQVDAIAIQQAKQQLGQGYTTSVLAIGSEAGAPVPSHQGGFLSDEQGAIWINKLDQLSLQQLAQAGGGRYHLVTTTDVDVDYILQSSILSKRQSPSKQLKTEIWFDQGYWLVVLMLPLLLLLFRRGAVAELF